MTDLMSHASVTVLPVHGACPTIGPEVDLRDLILGGDAVLKPIRYTDDVWLFEGYPFVNQTPTERLLDFTQVPPRWRVAVKDWCLLRLNPELGRTGASGLVTTDPMAEAAANEKPIRVMSAGAYIHGLGACFDVIESMAATEFDPAGWNDFAESMRRTYPGASSQTLAGYARPLLSLWAYRRVLGLPSDLFAGRPFNGRTPEALFKVPDRFINAGRPDAELCGPLLGLSLWIIDHCAEDVLARLKVLAAVPDRSSLPREDQIAVVHQLLLDYEKTGRPLPGNRSLATGVIAPGWSQFVRLAGGDRKALRNPLDPAGPLLRRLATERGVSTGEDVFGLPIAVVARPDGTEVPWIDALHPTKYDLGLDHWSVTLAYACAVVITMLTTVRDRELAALPHDCIRPGTFARGDVEIPVHRMHGFLVKNRNDPVPADWPVAADAVRAVEVLHRLKAVRGLGPRPHPVTGKDILFHPGLGRALDGNTKVGDSLQLNLGWLNWLQKSADHLAKRGLIRPLPAMPDGLAHRTLRITAIEAYASQEWGDALAASQAKWSSRTVAEGYLGHLPRSVFLADPDSIDEAESKARVRNLLGLALQLQDGTESIAGNGAGRVSQVLDDSGVLELATGPITSREMNRLVKSTDNVRLGELTLCAPGPGGLCGSDSEANWLLCRPFACRNSGMTRAHRARLELRRRAWAGRGGVQDRSARKIEEDAPDLGAEFAEWTDADVRALVIDDLPMPIARAAAEEPQ